MPFGLRSLPLERLFFLVLLATTASHAQWIIHPSPGTPRTRDGKVNLKAPAPRTQQRKPDLSGIWQANEATNEEVQQVLGFTPPSNESFNGLGEFRGSKHFYDILADFPAVNSPLRPEFRPVFEQHARTGGDGPDLHCLPIGTPGIYTWPTPYKIVQMKDYLLILSEADGRYREIFLDGRKLPNDPAPAWFGYSVGHWEGDTLVIESSGFNDRAWLDVAGHTHSEKMHLTERLRRRDFGHLDVEVTVNDPVMYSRPFTVKFTQQLLPDTNLIEYVCAENEKDAVHLQAAQRQ